MDQLNIKYIDEVAMPTELKIKDVDLSIILGNLINNAIEVCEKIKNSNK